MYKKLNITSLPILLIVCVLCMLAVGCTSKQRENQEIFREKADQLAKYALTDAVRWEIGDAPIAGVKHAVFFSICDTTSRARVYHGVGETVDQAWNAACLAVETALADGAPSPIWVKADIVYMSEKVTIQTISKAVKSSRSEFFRYGIAFDEEFETALLEAELNGAKILEYDSGGIDLQYLNSYLKKSGQNSRSSLPEECVVFRTCGWFCDEIGTVYPLAADVYDTGRRQIDFVDRELAVDLIQKASGFLLDQVRADGSFIYGYYPRFDNEIENYNIVRHASTLWSLLCRYRIQPDAELKDAIDQAIAYMLTQIRYADENTAYLYESKDDEIKLGGCGVAVIALTEYMDVFGNDDYLNLCCRLGVGILSMMNRTEGTYTHVLNGDYSKKEEFRTVYYDGEATFALSRLYGLTKDETWLEAACSAVDHFIKTDYTQYKDHWIAYTMNEITKYVTDRSEYYAFALKNAQVNLEEIRDRDTTYHTYLELLMATFEVYDRLCTTGASINGFDEDLFIETIHIRTVQMLNGFFFPEYAMYMENPTRILNTFMVRHDGYRVRIDDVQHNIGGY